MKKFLAPLMAIVLMCSMLVSCDDAQSLIEKADTALMEAPYAVTMKMNFECDNAELNEFFSLMNLEFPVTVDGNNIAMDMSMDMMGYTVGANVIVADMVVYYNMDMGGQNLKMKASMNEEQYREFMAENNTEMVVKPEDFGKLTIESKDGKKHIACLEISEDGIKELNGIIADSLEGIDAEATVTEVTYGVTLNDGKYESMDMTCVYSVTVADETVNVTFNLSSEFSYDNIAEITAPADADEYQELNYSDLMG